MWQKLLFAPSATQVVWRRLASGFISLRELVTCEAGQRRRHRTDAPHLTACPNCALLPLSSARSIEQPAHAYRLSSRYTFARIHSQDLKGIQQVFVIMSRVPPSSGGSRKISFNVSEQYDIQDMVGEGAYGVVCSAMHKHSGQKVAIKKITPCVELH
jgi:hypothetical protein